MEIPLVDIMKRLSQTKDHVRKQHKAKASKFSAVLIPAFVYSEVAVFLKAEELLLGVALPQLVHRQFSPSRKKSRKGTLVDFTKVCPVSLIGKG